MGFQGEICRAGEGSENYAANRGTFAVVDDPLAAAQSSRDTDERLSVQLEDETTGKVGVLSGKEVGGVVHLSDIVSLVESGDDTLNIGGVPSSGDVDVRRISALTDKGFLSYCEGKCGDGQENYY